MARSVVVAAGTADVQAFTGGATVVGYSVREAAVTGAVASAVIRDGTSSAGEPRAFVELAADSAETVELPVVYFSTGIFVDRVAGNTEFVFYLL